ncbi:hypothetical protein HanXRQr2_Chr15g0703881 [Helianthus annuus]|uniref:Uncharacterized protein n=1 Tax=Helianthus annuus TaxID=4232 RepID=A0A9K3H2V5_HELAN|nr:hypothetical protein HanXRQr2_Chr15g0703881 [Helianthus annuus]KAJ0451984.1 hypothetical protein HanHA300_Chr15g0573791 [Helianthus annuus]KAJ0473867.1 hypothetical protein HanHA89_Chr15g0623251 [Helianthus annuus]KAJ0649443.1 hypothetical protein HanLR1_Chr15g0584341 [Helianthus annuus]KAJ0653244.1 hypothetical protein HanOQP8_Chr15g0581351 [Helianthus annuus]
MNLKTKMMDHQSCVSKNCRMWSFILSTIKLFSLLNLNEQIWFLNWFAGTLFRSHPYMPKTPLQGFLFTCCISFYVSVLCFAYCLWSYHL